MHKRCIFIIFIACILVLGACLSSWQGDEGTVSISIGEADGRTAARDTGDAADGLLHTITLSGGPGPDQHRSGLKYGDTARFSVIPGWWTITIEAKQGGQPYASGSSRVNIKSGPNGVIPIKMTPTSTGEPGEPVVPNNSTPTADDFIVNGLSQIFDGHPKTVHITPNHDKSTGAITIYYDGDATAPSAIGSYIVTFDVAAVTGWNAAAGLHAGTLVIAEQTANPETPVSGDFDIGSLEQTLGEITAVTIRPKEGKSGGLITIYYNGSTNLPTAVGSYTVTFDITAAVGWYEATGLSAGTLTIKPRQGNAVITINLWLNEKDGTFKLNDEAVKEITILKTETLQLIWDGIDDYDSIVWYFRGSVIDGDYPYTIISPQEYNPGTYQLMVVVYKAGKPYSAEIQVTIQ